MLLGTPSRPLQVPVRNLPAEGRVLQDVQQCGACGIGGGLVANNLGEALQQEVSALAGQQACPVLIRRVVDR